MLLLHAFLDFTDCFTDSDRESIDSSPSYWYEGHCPQSADLLRLPRTRMSEEIARGLMEYLAADDSYNREGKMYGILLVEMPSGEQRILKAFSGLLNGCCVVDGWVPPIPGRSRVALTEARTLAQLEAMKQELIALNQLPQRQEYAALLSEFELQLQVLNARHRNCKQQRDEQRQLLCQTLAGDTLLIALEKLNQESRLEGIECRQLKRQRDAILQPIKKIVEAADERMRVLKQARKELSRQLQAEMHAAYSLVNFLGKSRSIQELMPTNSIPTGTGDCCAPKLLHCAAVHNLKPLAMAEFWWGPPSGDKVPGEFYGACSDRCQPLMGFLLSGLPQNPIVSGPKAYPAFTSPANSKNLSKAPFKKSVNQSFNGGIEARPTSQTFRGGQDTQPLLPTNHQNNHGGTGILPVTDRSWGTQDAQPLLPTNLKRFAGTSILPVTNPQEMLPIVYEDKWLIAVNKPSGLLSVPGRYLENQDSVLSRLQNLLQDGLELTAVHRLDLATSGILLLARDKETSSQLSLQFEKRRVHKVYEAVLSGTVNIEAGTIELPVKEDPKNSLVQQVNWEYGKPSVTRFQVMAKEGNCTRVEFLPLTGRTHQLRVHAADVRGLGMPILGDRLYGCRAAANRLHLHARELSFEHPQLGSRLSLQVATPF
ncbi:MULTISPECIES: pseudouridine synthase [unclassified Microcoleus]|uniref:RluA family pseudouridine synthase n=1 Tax=unclassified Microcoleus TaxID=2642155 RepID=UPI0025EDB947|nr:MULTISPECIES: pseudouridine synthase [unclassified Microcoleus]